MKFALLAILATIAVAAPAPKADGNAYEVDVERDLAHADIAARDAALMEARNDTEGADAADAEGNDDDAFDEGALTKRGYWLGKYFVGVAKTGGVNCRLRPTKNAPVKHYYGAGTRVPIFCQRIGQEVNGLPIWDMTNRGCYVSDSLVETGHNWIPRMRRC